MTFKPFLFSTFFLFPMYIFGQASLTNPLICHDKEKYLKCYNDGDYFLRFADGKFYEFKTVDNTLKYSGIDKTITFLHNKKVKGVLIVDTIRIRLLAQSILLKNDNSSLEISTMKELPIEIEDYGIGYYSTDKEISGLIFQAGEKYIKLEVRTYDKVWSWTIIAKENSRRFVIDQNSSKNNRIEHIFIQDDSLRYGMGISMTFKTLKKIWRLESSYVDTVRTLQNGIPVIGYIPLTSYYKYEYNKSGKLKTAKGVGELKLCDCN